MSQAQFFSGDLAHRETGFKICLMNTPTRPRRGKTRELAHREAGLCACFAVQSSEFPPENLGTLLGIVDHYCSCCHVMPALFLRVGRKQNVIEYQKRRCYQHNK